MEGEQKRGRKVEEKRSRRRKTGTATEPATTIGVAEEAANASAGDKRGLLRWRGLRGRMQWLSGDSGRGRVWGFLQDGTPLLWKWIGEGIVLLVGDLGIWPATAGTGV